MKQNDNLDLLQEILGYRFQKIEVLKEALAHSSLLSERHSKFKRKLKSNERLEFLGDRVLGLVIADLLFQQFPQEKEGFLARRLAALVRKETLADIAQDLRLGDYLHLSKG
jgi:ribonuclease-3